MDPNEWAALGVTLTLPSAGDSGIYDLPRSRGLLNQAFGLENVPPASVQGLPHPPFPAAPASLAGVPEYGDPPYQLHMHIQWEDGWSVSFRWDGGRLDVYAYGVIDIPVAKRYLRIFRQWMSVYATCAVCLTGRRTRVNYPCMCFCCCDGCAHHTCFMCGREVEDTLAVRFL